MRYLSQTKIVCFTLAGGLLLLPGCFGGGGGGSSSSTTAVDTASYNATASVGDFILIDIDRDAETIDYENLTNGQEGTADYSIDADGSYLITDPDGHFIRAWEIPDFAMVIEADNVGPSEDTTALISAVQSAPVGLSDLDGAAFNYIMFRTTDGGMELGSGEFDVSRNLNLSHYTPRRVQVGGSEFDGSTLPSSGFTDEGNYIRVDGGMGPDDISYMFRTPSGFWAVDTPNGAVVAMNKASSKDFDADWAGTYSAMVYQKDGAYMSDPDTEVGTPEILKGEITISATGEVTIVDSDSSSTVVANAPLTPIADNPALYDGTLDKLHDPCHGLFSFEVVSGTVTQEIFVGFLDDALIMSSFWYTVGDTTYYSYLYGFGLRGAGAAPTVTQGPDQNVTLPLALITP